MDKNFGLLSNSRTKPENLVYCTDDEGSRATGIGRAAAKRFIEEDAIVFIFGRRQEELDAAVADLM